MSRELELSGWLDDITREGGAGDLPGPMASPGLTITSFHLDLLRQSLQVSDETLISITCAQGVLRIVSVMN